MNMRTRYLAAALALSAFGVVSFVICLAWDAIFPEWAMREAWSPLFPGFSWISPADVLLGLTETVVYGFWIALVVPSTDIARRAITRRPGGQAELGQVIAS